MVKKSFFREFAVSLATLASMSLIVACGGSGGGNDGSVSTGGVYFTHDELAREFVKRMRTDAGTDLRLVKTYTLQNDYIVVLDEDMHTYDAYYLGDYNVGEDINRYLDRYENTFYYNLTPDGFGRYEDLYGVTFQVGSPSGTDHMKMEALKEGIITRKMVNRMTVELGMSETQAFKAAKAINILNRKSATMTAADVNMFTKDFLGTSVSAFQKAYADKVKTGDSGELKQLIKKASDKNGMDEAGFKRVLEMLDI